MQNFKIRKTKALKNFFFFEQKKIVNDHSLDSQKKF